jgi:hypothetical protein
VGGIVTMIGGWVVDYFIVTIILLVIIISRSGAAGVRVVKR